MAFSASDARILRLKWRLAFNAWERKLGRWVEAAKAGFDPNQPRVPAGNSNGGQWAGGAGRGKPGGNNKPKRNRPRHRPKTRRPSPVKKLTVPAPKVPAKTKGPLPPAPRIPKQPPTLRKIENRLAKQAGKWLLKAAARRVLGPLGLVLDAIDGAVWLHRHYPDIQSYFDEPRSLKELQDSVSDPLVGYEVHHIVEWAVVERDGIGTDLVESPENLVRIPAWKHHDITAWYMIKNPEYEGLSPREYLRGKSWGEKYQVGIKVLKDNGVLKP